MTRGESVVYYVFVGLDVTSSIFLVVATFWWISMDIGHKWVDWQPCFCLYLPSSSFVIRLFNERLFRVSPWEAFLCIWRRERERERAVFSNYLVHRIEPTRIDPHNTFLYIFFGGDGRLFIPSIFFKWYVQNPRIYNPIYTSSPNAPFLMIQRSVYWLITSLPPHFSLSFWFPHQMLPFKKMYRKKNFKSLSLSFSLHAHHAVNNFVPESLSNMQ